ncbi:MAG: phosphoenolpyruvate carboxykinase (ATP), partial [Alphaproteobacteria bacterium]|nr:phosphoenolpyruvate carboxykinase (ATP) [Alphaproteobacteria bacterium]
ERISLRDTRAIIKAVLEGALDDEPTITLPIFNLAVPQHIPGVDTAILDPRNSYDKQEDWSAKANHLAGLFIDNFVKFTNTSAGKALVEAGPKIS